MATDDKERLEAIMARMAAGDEAAAVTLFVEFGDKVRTKVRRVLRSQGATHLTNDDVDALAFDACLALVPRAGSWDPDGGALPWVWAERRIVSLVAAYVGRYGASFDETAGGATADVGDDPGDDPRDHHRDHEVLDRLAAWSPECALLRDALGSTCTGRDRDVLLMFTLQQDAGDPSPSVTVGRAFGLTPDNVRQIVRRVRCRIAGRAASDARYAPLAGLAFLRGVAARAA